MRIRRHEEEGQEGCCSHPEWPVQRPQGVCLLAEGTAKCLVSLKPRGEGERWDTKSKFTTISHGASKAREQRSKISTTV